MRDHTVSFVSSDDTGCEYIGKLTFTFVISKPFSYKGPAPTPSEIVLRRENSTLIAAHRGKVLPSDLKSQSLSKIRPRPEQAQTEPFTIGREYPGCKQIRYFLHSSVDL